MAGIIRPGRLAQQPQYAAQLAPGYRDAIFYSLFNAGAGVGRDIGQGGNHLLPGVSPAPVTSGSGRVLKFDGATTYLQTAKNFNPPQYTVLCYATQRVLNTGYNRIIDTSHIDGFTLLCLSGTGQWSWVASGSGLSSCVGNVPAPGQRVFLCATYDGAVARLYEDGRQTASVSWTTPTFNAQPITIGTNLTYSQYFDGIIERPGVFPRAFSAAEVWALYQNPWSLVQAPSRKIWIASAASGSAAGSAAGLAAATGVGASIASSVGSSSGLAASSGVGASIASTAGSSSGIASASGVGTSSTGSSGSSSGISAASGVGASTAASVGSSGGMGSASGVGASAAASVGSSSGIAAASGVGDFAAPGSAVGSAYGISSASGVGASIAAAVGSSDGLSSSRGIPLSTGQQSSGGYGGIYISREDRAERRKKQRIELGIIKEEKAALVPSLDKFEISNLSKKKPALVAAANSVDLAEQEALNAELKYLIALQVESEEEEILKILMEL